MPSHKLTRSIIILGLSLAVCFSVHVKGTHSPMPSLQNNLIVTDEDNGREVKVAKNKTLIVRLKTQLGTGYSWQIAKTDGNYLRALGKPAIEKSAKGLPGGTEHQVFRFKAQTSGSCQLEFHYVRPWEKGAAPLKTFRLKVSIS